MLIPGSSTCCNKRNRQACKCTTTTKGGGGLGCRSCIPPPRARCKEGKTRSCGRRQMGFRREFLYREESCIPPCSSSVPQEIEINDKSPTCPRGLSSRCRHPSGLHSFCRLPLPPSFPFPPSPLFPRKQSRPFPPPLHPREGKHKGAGSGGLPGGSHTPPGSPTIVPSQVPLWRLQLGFPWQSHDVIRKSNEIMFSNSKN